MNISSTDSVMGRNFVTKDSEESKYVKAAQVAAQVKKSAAVNRQNSILQAGISACENARTLADRIREGKKAARNMCFEMQISASEASKRNLDEIKENIEEKAEEAANAQTAANDGSDTQQKEALSDQQVQTDASAAENNKITTNEQRVENTNDIKNEVQNSSTDTKTGMHMDVVV